MYFYPCYKKMCGCIMTLIILAMAIFIPTSYMMGMVHGVASRSESLRLPKVEPMACGDCQKKRICANPPDNLRIFCK